MRPLLVVMILFSSVSAWARYRNDYLIPQTRTLQKGQVQFSVDRQAVLQKKKDDLAGAGHASTLGSSFGLWQSGSIAAEGGIDWSEPAVESVVNAIFGHLRFRIHDLEEDGWSFAFGVEKFGVISNKNDYNILYAMMQNRIGEDWYIGLGGYAGNSKFLVDHEGKSDAQGFSAGLWRQIQQGHGRMGLEFQSGRSSLGAIALGMTLELSESVYGNVSYAIANNQNLMRDWLLARLTVDF